MGTVASDTQQYCISLQAVEEQTQSLALKLTNLKTSFRKNTALPLTQLLFNNLMYVVVIVVS